MVEKLVEVGNLFDFYGRLLSDRQYNVIELFYIEDLSLSEIGEELNISRQGVYDTLKRAECKLYEYEDILGLYSKFNKRNIHVKSIIETALEIKKLSEYDCLKIYKLADEIESIGKDIIDK